ncbi:hypothetical protein RFI_07363 [Reticulomyxa filosa]|uniref:Double-strand break repair protein n=1 Tax=Reticulomyxa filosa TaxID=46433 RepID=X6NUQ8_RETFI|nr:hypothetical protein RFI_07363 [Reticulomyxa filosa]|eukprot:ETO29756.1 hypothetical protein RFI_07363 [Reticulomyxa filosa]
MDNDQEIKLDPYPKPDTFRILIVTDTHLGHLENDPIRRYDSFRAFDEALSIGQKYNVDFVLHGGDLFDKNCPSRFTFVKTTQILRKYCLVDKPVHFKIVSDQKRNFVPNGCVNFESPNMNVGMPIFVIHGNHDDPSGLGNHTALEQLSAADLINYFGKVDDLENIEIVPLFFFFFVNQSKNLKIKIKIKKRKLKKRSKRSSKLAIYGLGHIHDERLYRAFLHKKVKWVCPKSSENNDWFNICMLHQNRTNHTSQYKNYLPVDFLPAFLDILYWAHEHECLIELANIGEFYVTQPGSTVVTSLCPAEAVPKHVGILEIRGDACHLVPIRLKSARPFLFGDLRLSDRFELNLAVDDLYDFVSAKIYEMIEEASRYNSKKEERELTDDLHLSIVTNYEKPSNSNHATDDVKDARSMQVKDMCQLPLIRLRVDHTGFAKLHTTTFAQKFANLVANPSDLLLLQQTRRKKQSEPTGNLFGLGLDLDIVPTQPMIDIVTERLKVCLFNVFELDDMLTIFAEGDFLKNVEKFVQSEDADAIENFCNTNLKHIQEHLIGHGVDANSETIYEQCKELTNQRRLFIANEKKSNLIFPEEQDQSQFEKDNMDYSFKEDNEILSHKNHKKKEKAETNTAIEEHMEYSDKPKSKKKAMHSITDAEKPRNNIIPTRHNPITIEDSDEDIETKPRSTQLSNVTRSERSRRHGNIERKDLNWG